MRSFRQYLENQVNILSAYLRGAPIYFREKSGASASFTITPLSDLQHTEPDFDFCKYEYSLTPFIETRIFYVYRSGMISEKLHSLDTVIGQFTVEFSKENILESCKISPLRTVG